MSTFQGTETQLKSDSLLTASSSDDGESEDEDYGTGVVEGSRDQRTANEKAAMIRSYYKKKVHNIAYPELYELDGTISELIQSMEVPYRDELLDNRAVVYPLIDRYRHLDYGTICSLGRAVAYFRRPKLSEWRSTVPDAEAMLAQNSTWSVRGK